MTQVFSPFQIGDNIDPTTGEHYFQSGADGSKWYYREDNKHAARAEIENHHSAILQAVESKIGRKLTVREAVHGIDRPHLTEPQRLQIDLKFQALTAPPVEPDKPVLGPVLVDEGQDD